MFSFVITVLLVSISYAQPFPPDSVWTFAYDDGGDEYFYDAIEVSDGFLLCGEARAWNALAGEALLVKSDFEGQLVWSRRYPSERSRKLQAFTTEHLVWSQITSSGRLAGRLSLLYLDETGTLLNDSTWDLYDRPLEIANIGQVNPVNCEPGIGEKVVVTERLPDSTQNRIMSFTNCESPNSRLIAQGVGDRALGMVTVGYEPAICGETRDGTSGGKDGMLLWWRDFTYHREVVGGQSDDWFASVSQGGEFFKYTSTGGSWSFSNGSSDLWVVGIDSGEVLYSRHYGGLSYEDGVKIVNADDDGFIIAGNFSSEDVFFEQSDYWLLKVDDDGDSVWSLVAGGDEADKCEGMIQTENGFLLFGSSQSFAVPGWDGCAMLLSYVPDIAATPASLNFGPVNVGSSSVRTVGLINTGSNVLTVSEIMGTENYSADFPEPQTVAIGETLRVEITFAPQTPGTHVDSLRVISDALSGVKIVRCLGAGTAVDADDASLLPREFKLHPPYPNPFNPTTTLGFDLARRTTVELTIFDVQGRVVDVLSSESLSAGYYSRDWSCSTCAGGVYFARLRTSEFVGIQKLVLLK